MEKRKSPRLATSFPVRFNLAQVPVPFEAVSQNISTEGMMVNIGPKAEFSSLPLKQALDLEFNLPAAGVGAPFKTRARIIWLEKPKLGLQFIQVSIPQRDELSLYIREVLEQEVEVETRPLIDAFVAEMQQESQRQRISTLSFGWFFTYVPEEIIYAAGFIPYRIMGRAGPIIKAKSSLSGNLNPFVQSCLEAALNGDYNSFAGIVIGNADDASRRLYDVAKRYFTIPFVHLLDIPKTQELLSIERYRMELAFLVQRLEQHFHIQISSDSLKKAINLCNETRRLLNVLLLFRKKQEAIISSNQFLAITLAAMTVTKTLFNLRLKRLLEKLESAVAGQILPSFGRFAENRPRLLLTGSFQDNPALADIIAQAGGDLVCEDSCTRLRYFAGLVDTAIADPLLAIAKRYLSKPPGARMLDLDRRLQHLYFLVKEFKADGVIYYVLKFDDPYLFEFPQAREWLQSKGIPVLLLESDHRFAGIGQFKTRVQAFIETLELRLDR